MRYLIFNCYHCGELYYTQKPIKRKKCFKCSKTFQFSKSKKIKVDIPSHYGVNGIIDVLKHLKKLKVEKNNFDFKKEILRLYK